MKYQTKIGDVSIPGLDEFLKKRGFIHNKIIASWPTLAGDAKNCSFPLKINFPKNKKASGTLHIKIKSGLGPELEMQSKEIIDKINSMFGYKAINKIKLHNSFFKSDSNELGISFEKPILKSKINNNIKKIKNQKLAGVLIKLGAEIS